ncbi:Abi family protein [Mycoplasma marinum]|uniref:Abi family protein n=1 Tax=Mycoplasma marinum TaxID=1937190 RepID=UPI00374332F6
MNKQIKKMKKYDKRFIQSNKKIITPDKMYHQSLPIWFGVEGYELGQLQFIYNNIDSQEIKKNIASHFHIGSSNMNKFINVIREWRNIVAHKNTLFERSIHPRISSGKSIYLWNKLQIPKDERVNFSNNLTALMIVFNAFLSKVELKSLLNEIKTLFIGHSDSKRLVINFTELCTFFGLHVKLFENFGWFNNGALPQK